MKKYVIDVILFHIFIFLLIDIFTRGNYLFVSITLFSILISSIYFYCKKGIGVVGIENMKFIFDEKIKKEKYDSFFIGFNISFVLANFLLIILKLSGLYFY